VRIWLAAAILATAWLFGLGYFSPANSAVWLSALAGAVLLLGGTPVRFPGRLERCGALLLLLPTLWIVPRPYLGMPLLLGCGLVISLLPVRNAATRVVARGSVLASLVMLPQALVLLLYQNLTARAHDLPAVLAVPVAWWMRVLGAETTSASASLVVHDTGTADRFCATWELLLDPATLCVCVAGVVWLVYVAYRQRRSAEEGKQFWRSLAILLGVTMAWLPLRLALIVSLVVHQQLRADAATFPNVGRTLLSSWLHAGLACVLAVILSRLVPLPRRIPGGARAVDLRADARRTDVIRRMALLLAGGAAVFAAVFLYCWTPVGHCKGGRVVVVERHSGWEPTTEPYRDKVYGEAGSYNYAAAYEYCSQYYEMSRILKDQPITDAALQTCDVLIIKTPTSRYTPEEVDSVVRFVSQGGSLLLVGDHTNVFNMSTYLNDISRHFGFIFRDDLLFRVGAPYKQAYDPPRLSHPILQFMPSMYFAVSCSIDPGASVGSMVIRNVGLWNLPPAYQESNYHPQAEYRPSMQYGAWCQLWSTTHGQGRVLAFADSTLFSNFCVYQPGKIELLMGMLEWLNHSSVLDSVSAQRGLGYLAGIAGVVAAALGCVVVRQRPGGWMSLLSVTWVAWAMAAVVVVRVHERSLPLPAKRSSLPHVMIDRSLSTVPLFTGAFADDPDGGGYGLLEQWVPRIGNYTSRRGADDALSGEGLVVICPTLMPSQRFRDELIAWVQAGGRLVVFDTPDVADSTANSLLLLFGLNSIHNAPEQNGKPLRLADQSRETPLQASCEIQGGEALARWGDVPVAARVKFGAGSVTAIGFGSLFNDASMGYHWLDPPEAMELQRYEILYALLRAGLQQP
jgi:hypothetical protein